MIAPAGALLILGLAALVVLVVTNARATAEPTMTAV